MLVFCTVSIEMMGTTDGFVLWGCHLVCDMLLIIYNDQIPDSRLVLTLSIRIRLTTMRINGTTQISIIPPILADRKGNQMKFGTILNVYIKYLFQWTLSRTSTYRVPKDKVVYMCCLHPDSYDNIEAIQFLSWKQCVFRFVLLLISETSVKVISFNIYSHYFTIEYDVTCHVGNNIWNIS